MDVLPLLCSSEKPPGWPYWPKKHSREASRVGLHAICIVNAPEPSASEKPPAGTVTGFPFEAFSQPFEVHVTVAATAPSLPWPVRSVQTLVAPSCRPKPALSMPSKCATRPRRT